MSDKQTKKAVALISGGLDSLLAVRVIQEQGIYVEGINFYTGFCVEGHTHAIRKKDQKKLKRNNALWSAEKLGIKLHIIDIIEEYKDIVINPKHGYGANLNPCLDCKVFMVKKAFEWMQTHDFDFVITGEVVGQRPKSQRKDTLPLIQQESGVEDRLLRPLCAKKLTETLPEREGWVDRDKLLDFSGRNRKPQIALAKQFGYEDFAQPAGGCCFLTDESYSVKLEDLWSSRNQRNYEIDDIMLLKVGRHVRPVANFKIIIAREEGEGKFLQGYRKQYDSIMTISHAGPLALLDGSYNEEDIQLAARIVARYSQGRDAEEVELKYQTRDGNVSPIFIKPLAEKDIPREWVL